MKHIKSKKNHVSLAVIITMSTCVGGCANSHEMSRKMTDLRYEHHYHHLAKNIVDQMSTSELLDILSGPGMNAENTQIINLKDNVDGVAGYINGVKNAHLDIPALKLADGPAGLRISPTRTGSEDTFYATAWPIGSLLASTWNVNLVHDVGNAIGNEVKEYGVDILLAPGMNIQRNPRGGRNFEYYAEDPLLSGKIGAAMVNGVQSNHVGATIKHYVGNNQETNRMKSNTIADPRALREIYLRGFQIAIQEAHPWAVMTSYNKINGTYANERKDVMTSVLKNEWGFKGLIMSDWFAGNVSTEPYKQVLSGQALIEPGNVKAQLKSSLENGDISINMIKNRVIDIMTQVVKSPSYAEYQYSNQPNLEAHAVLSRAAADEGMILLKNQSHALPISDNKTVALFGVNQVNTYKGGTGSGDVNASYTVSIADGIHNRFSTNTDLTQFYRDYYKDNKVTIPGQFGGADTDACDEASVTGDYALPTDAGAKKLSDLITEAASTNDVAVISLGRQAGEGADRAIKDDYYLTNQEKQLITQVKSVFGTKPVIVVLNVNGIVDVAQWQEHADAILLAYMGGQETGNSVADILSGDVNPSGKLAQTIPAHYHDVPSANGTEADSVYFPGADTDNDGVTEVQYNEGIYVGYRYYNHDNNLEDVSYPFGYGLSYTTFNYSTPRIINTLQKDGSLSVSVTVTNKGSTPGKEVVQLYISAPEVKLPKPAYELKAFAKTKTLQPGESQRIKLRVSSDLLASFDPNTNQWIMEPGSYSAYISPSSDVTKALKQNFTLRKEIVVSETTPGVLALENNVTSPQTVFGN